MEWAAKKDGRLMGIIFGEGRWVLVAEVSKYTCAVAKTAKAETKLFSWVGWGSASFVQGDLIHSTHPRDPADY